MELKKKEDSPPAETESFYASLHRQIIQNGVRKAVREARSQLGSLTGVIKWVMVQSQEGISAKYCVSSTLLCVSRTIAITLKMQCSHIPSLSRVILKGTKGNLNKYSL